MSKLLPVLERKGKTFLKRMRVRARPADAGELIESITGDGKETEQRAKPGQFVVQNQTEARELYLMSKATLLSRYELVEGSRDGEWQEYSPTGKIAAIQVDEEILGMLNSDSPFEIMASWGSPQKVLQNDYLVSPLPEKDQIYRIAQSEFNQTYAEC